MTRTAKHKWKEMNLSKICGQLFCGKLCVPILKAGMKRMFFCKRRAWRTVSLPNAQRFKTARIFFVTDVCKSGGRIGIDFEMPFILCANNKYRIEATAAGKLDIPNPVGYPYGLYDFVVMGKKELLSFGGIVSVSSIRLGGCIVAGETTIMDLNR